VITDTLGDLIVDLLQGVQGSARQNATRNAHEMVSALSGWAETQGASDVLVALNELEQRFDGKTLPEERARWRPHLH
jgi:hypothetical protein